MKTIEELNAYLPKLIDKYNNAYSIPLNQLESVTRQLDKNKNIVFFRIEQNVLLIAVTSLATTTKNDLCVKDLFYSIWNLN